MRLDADPLAVSAVVDGTTVVLSSAMEFVRLDPVGAVIWELIEQGNDVDGIARALTERYEVSMQTARQDVGEFVEHLRQVGLVSISE